MGLEVEWVRYGRPAAEALRREIAAFKGGEPLDPVTVIVPSNHVGVAARRLLASGRLGPTCGRGIGLTAVTFVTTHRLAELLGAPRLAAAGRRPASNPVVAAAVRASLTDQPGVFAPVSDHAATEAALVDAYRELRDTGRPALDALAGAGSRAGDVVRLFRATRARLEAGWYDEQDLMAAAVDAIDDLAPDGWSALGLGGVVVYLPQRLSGPAVGLVTAVARRGSVVVLAGATGDARADAEVVASVARFGVTVPPCPAGDPCHVVAADRTRLVGTSDADDEVRVAVRAVVDAARSGTPLDRVAILHASPEPYARLIHEQLAAAGIPANGASVAPAAAHVAGRTLLQLLALPGCNFRRHDVFTWLAGAPLLHEGREAPVGQWERLSRDAAVVAGRVDWDHRLATLAEGLDRRAARADDDGDGDGDRPPWQIDRWRAEARSARSLRGFALALIDDLAAAGDRPRRWGAWAAWALGLLGELLGSSSDRAAWPVIERKAADRVELAVHRLAAVDRAEGEVSLEVFARTLRLELEADPGRIGRFGTGVMVGTVGAGLGLDLDLVVVLGLAEGSFPAPVTPDAVLPDHERQAAGGDLALRAERVGRQHRQLLASLAGARGHLLGIPRGDLRRSSSRVASRWALDLGGAVSGERSPSDGPARPERSGMSDVASFAAGLQALAFPATTQEHNLVSLLSDPGARPGSLAAAATVAGDPVLAGGADVLAGRRSSGFTRFDGNLAGMTVPSPADTVTSATRLERWAGCPFAYLMTDLLGAAGVDNPDEQLQISPITWGNLVHQALERFVQEVLDRPAADRPGPDEAWTAGDRARMDAIAGQVCDDFERRGLTGRPIFWRRDRVRVLADLRLFLDHDAAHRRHHRTRPVAAELAFGFGGSSLSAVPLGLPDGRVVRFRGRADRVDLAYDGTLHVVDYKTGKAKSYRNLSEAQPDLRGRKLQLAVYGAAARLHQAQPAAPVLAEYWFVSSGGDFQRIGYRVTDDVMSRVRCTLGSIVTGIEAGVFPAFPTATSSSPFVECPPCDPDALGVSELRRAWERKRTDPAVQIYVRLAELESDDFVSEGVEA